MTPTAREDWLTVAETAQRLKRSPKTIRNLVWKHGLGRRIIHQGRTKRRIMVLSAATQERLRRLCWYEGRP